MIEREICNLNLQILSYCTAIAGQMQVRFDSLPMSYLRQTCRMPKSFCFPRVCCSRSAIGAMTRSQDSQRALVRTLVFLRRCKSCVRLTPQPSWQIENHAIHSKGVGNTSPIPTCGHQDSNQRPMKKTISFVVIDAGMPLIEHV